MAQSVQVECTVNGSRRAALCSIEGEIPATAAVVTSVNPEVTSIVDMEGGVPVFLQKVTVLEGKSNKIYKTYVIYGAMKVNYIDEFFVCRNLTVFFSGCTRISLAYIYQSRIFAVRFFPRTLFPVRV